MPRLYLAFDLCTLLSSQGPDAPDLNLSAVFRATFKLYHDSVVFRNPGDNTESWWR